MLTFSYLLMFLLKLHVEGARILRNKELIKMEQQRIIVRRWQNIDSDITIEMLKNLELFGRSDLINGRLR